MLAAGLYESHKWEVSVILTYLSKLPGVEGRWDPEELHALVEAAAQMP